MSVKITTNSHRHKNRETICILRNGLGLDFNRYVQRVFRTEETARRHVNNLDHNVMLVRVPGTWRVGQAVPITTKTTTIR